MWETRHIIPDRSSGFTEGLNYCFQKLLTDSNHLNFILLSLDFFIASIDYDQYAKKKEIILNSVSKLWNDNYPVITVIPQSPVSVEFVLQYTFIKAEPVVPISLTGNYQENYLVAETIDSKLIFGSAESFFHTQESDARTCFSELTRNLKKNGFSLNNLIRQWNYIGKILYVEDATGRQNYQIFNDVRSYYFEKETYNDGYPAATGIGMDYPGTILKYIAILPKQELKIIPLNNPMQLPAYKYSEKVLAGKPTGIDIPKTTPKFERGKVLCSGNLRKVLVSGTASIYGEENHPDENLNTQTIKTLRLITALVSAKNLSFHGCRIQKIPTPLNFQAYIKKPDDELDALRICKSYFGNIPGFATVADICRNELLVEIECEFGISI